MRCAFPEWHFHVALLIMPSTAGVLTFEDSTDETVTIQVKATKQFFSKVLFIMLYEMPLTMDEPQLCNHTFKWNDTSWL